MALSKKSRLAHLAFYQRYGAGLYHCHFCGERIRVVWKDGGCPSRRQLVSNETRICIHHLDEDHTNNFYKNLVIAHHSCHSKFHQTGRKRSAESKERHRIAHLGKPWSEKQRAGRERYHAREKK